MTIIAPATERIAELFRQHLEEKFAGDLEFTHIEIVPEEDYYGDPYLHAYIVYQGDFNKLDHRWLNGLARRMDPEIRELGLTRSPVESYIEQSEWFELGSVTRRVEDMD